MLGTRVDPPIRVVLAATLPVGVSPCRGRHPDGRACADCGIRLHQPYEDGPPDSRHNGRGLCSRCYTHHAVAGTLVEYPRSNWSCEDLVTEAEMVRGEHGDWTWPRVAAAIGVSFRRLDQARTRHNRRRRAAGERVPRFHRPLSGCVLNNMDRERYAR